MVLRRAGTKALSGEMMVVMTAGLTVSWTAYAMVV